MHSSGSCGLCNLPACLPACLPALPALKQFPLPLAADPQVEVEQQFIGELQLNAIYNPKYWLNLALAGDTQWFWADGLYTPGPDIGTGYYRHWGAWCCPYCISSIGIPSAMRSVVL